MLKLNFNKCTLIIENKSVYMAKHLKYKLNHIKNTHTNYRLM